MLKKAEMSEFLAKAGSARLLVVGDIMLDSYVIGESSRLSPEAPVPVLLVEKEENTLGGAGNAFANIVSFGAKADIIAVIGHDEQGEIVKTKVETAGGNPDCLIYDDSRPTISKTRYMKGHQHLMRCDREKTTPVSADIEDKILVKVKQQIEKIGVLVLSDYGKGTFADPEFVQKLISLAHERDIPVVVDPKGRDFSKYAKACFITPNKKELAEATNTEAARSDKDIEIQAAQLIDTYGFEYVLATRSEEGLSLISKEGKADHISTQVEEVFDVSGAGDTVIAVFATMLATGLATEKCAWLANLAGSVVVRKAGTSQITSSELEERAA